MGQKLLRMVLYAEPGVGKSTFASKAPNPFFICTDGNFDWLDLPERNHAQISSWNDAKQWFAKLRTPEYDEFETIVIDLIEDLFKWNEYEFCKKNRLDYIGDMDYGKGYGITRGEFFVEISKLMTINKHIIILSHESVDKTKDRRGIEQTKYIPSAKIPLDKPNCWEDIEGIVRYFLRAYMKPEQDENGKIRKARYLSLVPKENEFGIARGIDEYETPHDIPLDWNVFSDVIGLNDVTSNKPVVKKVAAPETVVRTKVVEAAKSEVVADEPKIEEVKTTPAPAPVETAAETPKTTTTTRTRRPTAPTTVEPKPVVTETKEPEVKVVEPSEPPKPLTNEEKFAAIKAKLAAQKKAMK